MTGKGRSFRRGYRQELSVVRHEPVASSRRRMSPLDPILPLANVRSRATEDARTRLQDAPPF
jgi:hypothetical protein